MSLRRFFGLRKTGQRNVDYLRGAWIRLGKKGPVVNEESAMQVAAFYRGLMYISTQIAKLPWEVKSRDNLAVEDAVYNLISLSPNPEMNAFSFRLQATQNAIVFGNSYAEIERNAMGRPVALWPLPSRDVEPVRLQNGKLVYRVLSSTYFERGPTETILEPKDVFHIKNFHTKDGLVGQGVVAYGRDVLGISLGGDMMAKGLFANSGIPSGYIKLKGSLSPEGAKRLKESWNNSHGGEGSGGTAVLEEDAEYKTISLDPEVLQFLESRKFGVLEIARFLNVPPTKLFDTSAATYSNLEQSNLEVATDVLDAWACNYEMEADVKLLNNRFGGKYTVMDLYSVFRGDMKARSDYFSKMLQNASMTPNEIRALEGRPKYPQGDNFYIAANNYTPVDRMDEVIDSQIQRNSPPESPAPEEPSPEEVELNRAAITFLKGK